MENNVWKKISGIISKSTPQLILVFLLAFFSILLGKRFFTFDNLISIVRQVSTTGIAAMGITFLMITGNLDFSTGSIYALVGVIAALLHRAGVNIYLAILVSIICGVALSCLSCFISIKFKITRLVVSMAMNTALSGLAQIIAGNTNVYGLPESIKWIGQGYVWVLPVSTLIFAGLAVLVNFILKRTFLGRYMFALGGSEVVAKLSGINVNKIKYVASAIAGFLVSFAGIVCMSRTFAGSPSAGGTLSMDVISAAVLGGVSVAGGTGNTKGLVTGVIIMGTLSVGLNILGLNTTAQGIFKGGMLLLAVIIDSYSKMEKKKKAAK